MKTTVFWKALIIFLGLLTLSSSLIGISGFWSSYVLDIAGPALGYSLIRAQYKSSKATFLSLRFSPELAVILIVGICILIETSQYLELYESYFDPYDLLAYVSAIIPIYIIDKLIIARRKHYRSDRSIRSVYLTSRTVNLSAISRAVVMVLRSVNSSPVLPE